MKYTKNYNLNIPDMEDQFNIDHWNENAEKTDAALHGLQEQSDATDATVDANRRDADGKISAINAKISPQASAQNQLADKKYVTDRVAEVVANAPEDFDTLKEMSDWISNHEDSAAAMNSQIMANEAALNAHEDDKAAHGATSEATANRIAMRDGSGRLKVAAPSAGDDAVNLTYLNSKVQVVENTLLTTAVCSTAGNVALKEVTISREVTDGFTLDVIFLNRHTLLPAGQWAFSDKKVFNSDGWVPTAPNLSLRVKWGGGAGQYKESNIYWNGIVCNGQNVWPANGKVSFVWRNNRWNATAGLTTIRQYPDIAKLGRINDSESPIRSAAPIRDEYSAEEEDNVVINPRWMIQDSHYELSVGQIVEVGDVNSWRHYWSPATLDASYPVIQNAYRRTIWVWCYTGSSGYYTSTAWGSTADTFVENVENDSASSTYRKAEITQIQRFRNCIRWWITRGGQYTNVEI